MDKNNVIITYNFKGNPFDEVVAFSSKLRVVGALQIEFLSEGDVITLKATFPLINNYGEE